MESKNNDSNLYAGLTQLGSSAQITSSPIDAVIETVLNPHPDSDYIVRFACPEFTSLCPITQQPDFATIIIDYLPDLTLIESKSLKLYIASYRNYGAFHEACTISIAKKLICAAKPKWLRIGGYWYPRGGIPIDIFYQTNELPPHIWLPEINVSTYRGR